MTIILLMLSIVSISFTLFYPSEYYLALLPISFLFLTMVFFNVNRIFIDSFVFKIFLAQAIIRYLLLPVLFSIDPDIIGIQSKKINIAIFIMVFEFLCVYLVFLFFSNQQKNTSISKPYFFKGLYFIPILLIFIFCYIYLSGALVKVNAIWDLDDFVDKYITQGEELSYNIAGILLFNLFKILLLLYFFSKIFYAKNINYNLKKWLYAILIISSGLFILGVSRFSILLNMAVMFALLNSFIEKKEVNKVIYFSLPIVFFILLIATLAKFSRYGDEVTGEAVLTARVINAYFAGFGNIAIGLDAYDHLYNNSLLYVINDTIQNVPLLSKFALEEYKTNVKFNEMIYGHRNWADQIVPLSISGLFHFGYIGLFLYSPIFMAIALYFEKISKSVKFIGYKYVFTYLSINFSLVFMLNLGSFYGSFFNNILFILFPLTFIYLFDKKKVTFR
ncbi:O-antigen polymerase [Acinetobacter indicus]|uniref:O-antigen polymerase n=1 Tax=Acinetobacter indicus TaxID=756892 RepID=UPI00257566A2|nr:O-antigen polymerase [Acinetobacter indicus]